MNFSIFRTVTIVGLMALVIMPVTTSSSAQGQELVLRSFIYWVPPDQDPPDFFDPSSFAVLVTGQPHEADDVQFANFGQAPELHGTLWKHKSTVHITQGNPMEDPGLFYWNINAGSPEPPRAGTMTFTGSDSPLIIDQQLYSVSQCASGTCGSANNGKWYVPSSGGQHQIVVVTALFSR